MEHSQTFMEHLQTFMEHSQTFMKRSKKGHANGQECLGTFESGRRNALERIVENVNVTVTVRSLSRFKNEKNAVNLNSKNKRLFKKNSL